ncbi:MAG: acetolactate synthase small subunit [Clostridiales bacterium]|nr:acetolactate synthase small subunit [Clostridiales bacterium]
MSDGIYTVSILVENTSGVLSRVVGMFTRRAFNIHSLSVGTTNEENISRITIEVKGDALTVEQVTKQLSKIMEVIKIKILKNADMVKRGIMLCKVKTSTKTRSEVLEIANIFRAKVVDIAPSTVVIEITGGPSKLDAFIDMISPYGIEELARTGMTALERGSNTLKI